MARHPPPTAQRDGILSERSGVHPPNPTYEPAHPVDQSRPLLVFRAGPVQIRPKKPGGVNTSARMRRGSGVNGAFLPYSRLVLCRWPVDGAGSCQMVSKTGVVAKAESAMYAIP